jgi:hypothetical protein
MPNAKPTTKSIREPPFSGANHTLPASGDRFELEGISEDDGDVVDLAGTDELANITGNISYTCGV